MIDGPLHRLGLAGYLSVFRITHPRAPHLLHNLMKLHSPSPSSSQEYMGHESVKQDFPNRASFEALAALRLMF